MCDKIRKDFERLIKKPPMWCKWSESEGQYVAYKMGGLVKVKEYNRDYRIFCEGIKVGQSQQEELRHCQHCKQWVPLKCADPSGNLESGFCEPAPTGLVIYDSKGRAYSEDQIAAILEHIEKASPAVVPEGYALIEKGFIPESASRAGRKTWDALDGVAGTTTKLNAVFEAMVIAADADPAPEGRGGQAGGEHE